MKKIHYTTALTVIAAAVLLPVSLMAGPIVVSINDVPNGRPVIQVKGAPNGYDLYTGEAVATPGVEEGALITLIGVNNWFEDPDAYLDDWEGRFVIPEAPNPARTAVDIVWVEHNWDDPLSPLFGDLRVGFDSALAGAYYRTVNSLGLVTDNWVTVYANDTLVVRFKPHTYRLRN